MRLTAYIKASQPCVCIATHEEVRVAMLLDKIADEVGYRLFSWDAVDGLMDVKNQAYVGNKGESANPVAMFKAVEALPKKSLVMLADFHMYLQAGRVSPDFVRRLRQLFTICKNSHKTVIPVGCHFNLPPELEKEIVLMDLPLPTREEIDVLVDQMQAASGSPVNGEKFRLIDACCGLTTQEIENTLALSHVMLNKLDPDIAAREKAECVKKGGLLEIISTDDITVDSMGGYDVVKDWVKRRTAAFTTKAREFGLMTPKGVMVAGVPGTGKTLLAKIVAKVLGLPLLSLDPGKLFGGLVGESERNARAVIHQVEAASPCVLLIDEIEKGLAGLGSSGKSDGGTTARVIGTFLSWLNDKKSPVFVVATANNLSALPPEMLRKGRWDELFFVDLPSPEERKEIWKVCINRRGRDVKKLGIDLGTLVESSNDFTGAEIQSCVDDAMYAAFSDDADLTTDYLVAATKTCIPLARTNKEELDMMRQWGSNGARSASTAKRTANLMSAAVRKLND